MPCDPFSRQCSSHWYIFGIQITIFCDLLNAFMCKVLISRFEASSRLNSFIKMMLPFRWLKKYNKNVINTVRISILNMKITRFVEINSFMVKVPIKGQNCYRSFCVGIRCRYYFFTAEI